MKVLLSCNNFSYLSGSPLYVYTLSKELVKLGNEVTVYSAYIGGIITDKAREAGIEVIDKLDPNRKFDVMHLNQGWSAHVLDVYDIPAVYTIHSEFPCEQPVISDKIKQYIAIRPSIAEKWNLPCEIIYNPIDFERFHSFEKPKEEMVLFVGTIDTLRMESAFHLKKDCEVNNKKCRFVGQKFANWANNFDNWYPETWDIENHLKDATETAGILLGRSTIEGWACGLPGTIYEVDINGHITDVNKYDPPEDMSKFDSRLVAKQILKIYNDITKI